MSSHRWHNASVRRFQGHKLLHLIAHECVVKSASLAGTARRWWIWTFPAAFALLAARSPRGLVSPAVWFSWLCQVDVQLQWTQILQMLIFQFVYTLMNDDDTCWVKSVKWFKIKIYIWDRNTVWTECLFIKGCGYFDYLQNHDFILLYTESYGVKNTCKN